MRARIVTILCYVRPCWFVVLIYIFIYIYIGVFLLWNCATYMHMEMFQRSVHTLGFWEFLGIFFFVLEDILEVTLQNDENILSILYFKCCSTLKCWYYYSVFSRGTLYCQIFSILYALIVFSNFVAKIPFIKFLYISYCSVVLYDFFFIIGINAFGLIFYL